MNKLFFLPFVGFGIFTLIIPILIGIFVYNDAPKYNMDRLLWILVSILVPGLVGFIVYLIISRTNESKPSHLYTRSCPVCGKKVEKEFSTCPYCGSSIEKLCPGCGKRIEDDWIVCPYCSYKLK